MRVNPRIKRARELQRRLAALALEERLRMTPQERQLADLRRDDHLYRPELLRAKPPRGPDGAPRLSDE